MGRIKTAQIKRVTRELMELHGSEFTDNFERNQEIVGKLISTPSKKLRNKIVGYVTKIVGRNKKLEEGGTSY